MGRAGAGVLGRSDDGLQLGVGEPVVSHGIGIGARIGFVDLGHVGGDDAALSPYSDGQSDGDRVGGVTWAGSTHDDDLPLFEQRDRFVDAVRDGTGDWDAGVGKALSDDGGIQAGRCDADSVEPVLRVDDGPCESYSLARGGSAADGTYLAHALRERHLGPAFVCLYDPESARRAREAQPGRSLALSVGGKTDDWHGPPLEAVFRVISLHDGRFSEPNPRHGGFTEFDQGPTAVVETPDGLTEALVEAFNAMLASRNENAVLAVALGAEKLIFLSDVSGVQDAAGEVVSRFSPPELRELIEEDGEIHRYNTAVLVDKDHAPQWSAARIEDVGDEAIEAYFSPVEPDLNFD